MCQLHQRKIGLSYASLNYLDRQLVDTAWSCARKCKPALGWALEARIAGSPTIFSSSAIDGDFPEVELTAVRAAIASEAEVLRRLSREPTDADRMVIRRAVVVHERGYWPSKAFVELLASKALPLDISLATGNPRSRSDVLFVNHSNGVIVSWDVDQLQKCEHTTDEIQAAAKEFALA